MQRTAASRTVSGGSFGDLNEDLLGDEMRRRRVVSQSDWPAPPPATPPLGRRFEPGFAGAGW